MATTYIYSLNDPDTLEVRYVGKSNNPWRRLPGHLNDTKRTHKVNWIKSLKAIDKKPTLLIIEQVDIDQWEEAEMRWIAHYRSIMGEKLTNTTDGGDGVKGPLIGAKISAAKMGHPVSEETRQKLSIAKRNPSEEIRKKLSLSHLGKKLSKETRERMSQAFKGRVYSDKTRERMALAQLGRKRTPETRKKLSETTKSYMNKPGIREKQSKACLNQWADQGYRKRRSEETRLLWSDPDYRRRMSEAHKKTNLHQKKSICP